MSSQRANQLVEAGVWLRLSGDHAGARRLFEQALKLDPSNEKAKSMLANDPLAQAPKAPPPTPTPPPVSSSMPSIAPMSAMPPAPQSRVETQSKPSFPVPPNLSPRIDPPLPTEILPPPSAPMPGYAPLDPDQFSSPTMVYGSTTPEPPRPMPLTNDGQLPPLPELPPVPGFAPAPAWPAPLEKPPLLLTEEVPYDSAEISYTPVPLSPKAAAALEVIAPSSTSATEAPPVPEYHLDSSDWSHALSGESQKSLVPDATSAWDSQSNPGVKLSMIEPAGDAMDMIANDPLPTPPKPLTPKGVPVSSAPPSDSDEVETLLKGAKDLIDLDDHTGAMDLINKAAELAPNDSRVKKMREKSEATLQTMFESKIGKLDATPHVVLKDDEIIWLNLDHRAGFVLAQIDGAVTFEDIFAVSGMSRLDTARILAQLVEEGVIRAN